MTRPNFDPDRKAVLDSFLLDIPQVREGKMFGYPAYYVGGKLFACIYGTGVGLKVPESIANELLAGTHVVPFQPAGRPKMREWVQINRERPDDYLKDASVFRLSLEFVRRLTALKRKTER